MAVWWQRLCWAITLGVLTINASVVWELARKGMRGSWGNWLGLSLGVAAYVLFVLYLAIGPAR